MSIACKLLALLLMYHVSAVSVEEIYRSPAPHEVCSAIDLETKSTDYSLVTQAGPNKQLMEAGIRAALRIMQLPGWARTHHVVEVFAGRCTITKAAWKLGLRAVPFDKELHTEQDVLDVRGFTWVLTLIASIVPGGLLWLAPQCSTWLGFLSQKHMKRNSQNEFWGDRGRTDVVDANTCACLVAFFIAWADALGVRYCIENPPTSLLWKFPPLAERLLETSCVYYHTWGGAMGWETLKPLGLATTIHPDFVQRLVFTRKAAIEAVNILAASEGREVEPLITLEAPKGGVGKCWKQGSKPRIKESQGYPEHFGHIVASMISSMFLLPARTNL